MAAQVGALRVTVGADISGLTTGMKRAERQVQTSASAMQRAVTGMNKSFQGLGSIAGVSLGAAGLLAAGSAFLRVADTAKAMTAQLKLATAQYGSFAKAQSDVRAIAESSRSSLAATAQLYAAIQRNAGELGNTQAETARMTKTVTESFAVFGSSAMEAEAATRQLVQAFQSGRLQGDEFRSLMENAPRLVKLLADSLGVTTGALRKMSQEGELTADKLIKAFTDVKLTEQLDKEFAAMPVTFDQAMTQIYNAAVITFSAFDRGGQFSNSIASFVQDGSTGFKDLEKAAFDFGQGVSDLFTALDQIRSALGSLHSDGIGAFVGLTDVAFSWRDALALALGVLDGIVNQVANLANFPGNVVRLAMGYDPIVNPSDMRGGFLGATSDKRTGEQRFGGLFRGGTGKTPPPFHAQPAKAKKAKKGPKPPRDRSEDVAYQFENELRQAQMDILRASQSLTRDYNERAQISLQMLDLEKASFEAEVAEKVRKAQRDLAEGKITSLAFSQVRAHAEALRAANNETDALKRQAVAQEVLQQQFEDRVRLADAELDNQQDLLNSQADLATTAAEQRDIQLRLLDLSYRQEKARLRAVLADEQASVAAKDEAQTRLNMLSEVYANRRQGVINSTRNPLEEWAASIPQTAAEINEAFQSIQVNAIDGLTDAIEGLITGTQSLKEAFGSLAKSVVADILRMTIRMLIFRAISGVIGGGGMNFGKAAADLNSQPVPVNIPGFASGGSIKVLGRGGTDRNLLSLNGMPIARVGHGERIDVSQNGGGGSRVEVIPSPYFDVIVDGRIVQRAGPMAGHAAVAGAAGGMAGMARTRERALP